ncbi:hypothetical protein PORY_002521 [Pneumocystis oryctolagi]|uniref:Uncharacterized protein n=1 Tax=Pneumocystis oryctolagi TaxID=42067 RepID=A0ACB7C8Y5_9ASCO|nr:hypothetical protein PORY_002521 [Pneumocystis oryctolagi]
MGLFWADSHFKTRSTCSSLDSSSCDKKFYEKCPILKHKFKNTCSDDIKNDEINLLNKVPKNLPQTKAHGQKIVLPTKRTMSSIPRYDTNENWEYPSPQQMYHAIIQKGHLNVQEDAVEPMVEIHNFLNESAWNEIKKWEERRGCYNPKLSHFKGRASNPTLKSRLLYYIGKIYPSKFAYFYVRFSLPFDTHDWYVSRDGKIVRYVIDYYDAPSEPSGEPVFYLDIRPAIDTPTAAYDRICVWTSNVWIQLSKKLEELLS